MFDISQVKYDERGLVPAVCQDAATGEVLMVAWMDAEALSRTLTSGLATFWSRSRGEIWLKGATSGNYLHVESIAADCDGDTLLVRVRPDGPACHTGARSCFFNEIAGQGGKLLALEDPRADYHMHTTWSDAENSAREMIETAIACGLTRIGFTDHSFTDFDPGYCMAPEDYAPYQAEIRALAAEYADRIQVLCGLEQDYLSPWPGRSFDYLVGSVHFVRVPGTNKGTLVTLDNPDGEFVAVDAYSEVLRPSIDRFYDGDPYAFAEAFFAMEADVVRATGCSIIGHFDLLKCLNARLHLFDEGHPRYVAAWQQAADALLACDVPFEINVNGVAKGRTAECYPSPAIVAYLRERGARFVFSGDAHATRYLRAHDGRPELAAYRVMLQG